MKSHFLRISIAFFFLLLFLAPKNASSISDIQGLRFGLKLPYTYDIGYYHRFSTRIGMYASTQFVTVPFSKSVTGLMNLYGAEPKITAILDGQYNFGFGLEHGWQYYFGKDNRRYYGGISVAWMSLPKQEIDDEVINEALADDPIIGCETLDACPINTAHQFPDSKALTINTNYVNVSLTFGITFKVHGNKKGEFRLEGQVAKTVASRHALYSEYRYISPISDRINADLQETMMKYGWFPSINLFYIHKL